MDAGALALAVSAAICCGSKGEKKKTAKTFPLLFKKKKQKKKRIQQKRKTCSVQRLETDSLFNEGIFAR